MKNIVIINGSPRFDGNTATILQMIEKGAKEHQASVLWHTLFRMKFMACQGCFSCRVNDSCAVKDEISEKVIPEIEVADALVIGSPVYFMQVTGPVKNFYDRMFPLIGQDGKPRFGFKKLVTVYTQDYEDPHMFESYFDYLASTFPSFGFNEVERIVCGNANNPETAENNFALKSRAYEVGTRLAKGE